MHGVTTTSKFNNSNFKANCGTFVGNILSLISRGSN